MKIAIASGKGGTGKTTLSTNLACYLAETEPIVFADLDVEEPNSGLFVKGNLTNSKDTFKMVPEWDKEKCTLCGKCQEVCAFNAIIQPPEQIMVFPNLCHSCYACSELCPAGALPMVPEKMGSLKHFSLGQLSFIEGRLDIGQEQAVPLIGQVKEYIDKNFADENIKLFDSPPGTSCPVIEAVKDADFVILVTEPTPFGLYDLQLAVDTIRELKKDFAIVINRHGIGNEDVMNYCKQENINILAKIPNSRHVAELYSKGEMIYPKVPAFKEQLERIKTHIKVLKGGAA